MGQLLRTAVHTLTTGAQHLGLSQSDVDRLIAPYRTLEVQLPVQIDGSQRMLPAWRVQHNVNLGPGKGGVRFAPGVNRDEVTGLATIMTLKNALAGLPFGGAKGGVQVDTSDLDDEARERLADALAKAYGEFVGPETDILGPDVGTGGLDMAEFTDRWQTHTGIDSNAVATGKPKERGGIDIRTGATATGCADAIAIARDRMSLGTDATVAIQGFGALGRHLAELLSEAGHPIVAVSDSGGGIFNADGLSIDDVIAAKEDSGSVSDADGETIGSIDVLTCDAAIVVPAALQSIVDIDIADQIKAELVVEGSNGPSTVDGIDRLNKRGLTVIPDFAANAGGVIGSFHEWQTNLGNAHDDPADDMDKRMRELNNVMWDRAESDGVNLRVAAAAIAIERVLDA